MKRLLVLGFLLATAALAHAEKVKVFIRYDVNGYPQLAKDVQGNLSNHAASYLQQEIGKLLDVTDFSETPGENGFFVEIRGQSRASSTHDTGEQIRKVAIEAAELVKAAKTSLAQFRIELEERRTATREAESVDAAADESAREKLTTRPQPRLDLEVKDKLIADMTILDVPSRVPAPTTGGPTTTGVDGVLYPAGPKKEPRRAAGVRCSRADFQPQIWTVEHHPVQVQHVPAEDGVLVVPPAEDVRPDFRQVADDQPNREDWAFDWPTVEPGHSFPLERCQSQRIDHPLGYHAAVGPAVRECREVGVPLAGRGGDLEPDEPGGGAIRPRNLIRVTERPTHARTTRVDGMRITGRGCSVTSRQRMGR